MGFLGVWERCERAERYDGEEDGAVNVGYVHKLVLTILKMVTLYCKLT